MKAGQITAKLRDAVPVCFYQDGEEVIRYKNVDVKARIKCHGKDREGIPGNSRESRGKARQHKG
jgi:hypothetical protein